MKIQADTLEKYIVQLPDERKQAIKKIRKVILENLPDGFTESMNYGMIGYVVSHSFYPGGYHCDPKQPLPFISIASQKNYIVLYHSGIYADTKIHDWFVTEYAKHCKSRLDMGKSCIRFKKIDEIPYKLIAELVRKMSSKEWIEIYETNIKR